MLGQGSYSATRDQTARSTFSGARVSVRESRTSSTAFPAMMKVDSVSSGSKAVAAERCSLEYESAGPLVPQEYHSQVVSGHCSVQMATEKNQTQIQ